MKYCISILVLLLLFGACNKNRQIKGRLLNGATSKGIVGAPMYLLQLTDSEKVLGKAQYTETNEQGYFSFKQPRIKKKFQQVLRCNLLEDNAYYPLFSDSIYLDENSVNETFNLLLFKKHTVHVNLISDQEYYDEEVRLSLDFSTPKTGVYETYNMLKGTFKKLENYNEAYFFGLEGQNTISGSYTIDGGTPVPVSLSFSIPEDVFYPVTIDIEIQ